MQTTKNICAQKQEYTYMQTHIYVYYMETSEATISNENNNEEKPTTKANKEAIIIYQVCVKDHLAL